MRDFRFYQTAVEMVLNEINITLYGLIIYYLLQKSTRSIGGNNLPAYLFWWKTSSTLEIDFIRLKKMTSGRFEKHLRDDR